MNSNTIVGYIGGTKRNQIPSLVLAAVTETAIPLNTDTGTTSAIVAIPQFNAVVGSSTPLGPNANASILQPIGGGIVKLNGGQAGTEAPWFGSSAFDGSRPFQIRLIGTGSAAANAGNTLTVKIYQGTSATIGSDTLISTPLNAVATASAANLRFYIEVTGYWDSTNQALNGVLSGNYTYNGTTTLITAAGTTQVSSLTSTSSLSFLASITWGNAVGGTINVSEFSISQL